ncbi:hypothetical protein U3A55_04440 [Salarchaeum sp. III]|uniref:hypothetical protein n=1 Tax=Salarchaeum sp. III TaxID=3107927 RepID=UPI002EDB2726
MSDPALRRTIRRCTAVFVLALAATLSTIQSILTQNGFSSDSTLLTTVLFFGSTLYLIGSIGHTFLSSE